MATTTSSSKSHFLAGPADSDGLGVFYCGLCVLDGTCVCLCLCNRERGKEAYLPSPISSKRKTTKKKTLESPSPYSKEKNIPLTNQFSISSPPSRPTPSTSTPSASKLPNWPIITIPPIPTSPVPLLSRCCYVLSERQFLVYSEISLGGNGRWYVMSLTILFLPD